MVGDPLQHPREVTPLDVGEGRADGGFVLGARVGQPAQGVVTLLGQVQRVMSAVMRIAPPLKNAAALEIVDEGTSRLGWMPSCSATACWLRPGSAAIAYSNPR